jgi:hypothetical protein
MFMQTDDVQLTSLFTTNSPNAARDNTPNEVAGQRQADFTLVLSAEAGDNLGDLSAAYTLIISATSTSGGTTTFPQRKLKETVTDGQFNWSDLGKNNGYVKLDNLKVPASQFPSGDVYQFTATLVAKNGIISTIKSNEFVTI